MTKQHPITPPPELVQQWDNEGTELFRPEYQQHLTTQAARWGADQELEACCEWFLLEGWHPDHPNKLRAARRPKPPRLKAQALGALYAIATGADDTREFHQDIETIKTALESLPD